MKRLFYPGQPVICINDDFSWARKHYPDVNLAWPTFGKRYIVRDYVCGGRHPALVLYEITNPNVIYSDGEIKEAGFWEKRFVGAPPPTEAIMGNKVTVGEFKEKEMV